MRMWALLCCFFLLACGEEPREVSLTQTVTDTGKIITPVVATDTGKSLAQDIVTAPPPPPVETLKKPSGIYRFVYPFDEKTKILHTVAFYPATFRLQEEYLNKKDSITVTNGTWSPSQGFIWLYKDQLVRGRYAWKGDTLQYYSPALKRRFSMTRLTPVTTSPVWAEKKNEGAVLYGVGTEPLWSVEITRGDSVILSMPEWSSPLRLKVDSTLKEKDKTVFTASTDSLQLSVFPYFCSDGMSDFIYSNKLKLSYKGQAYKGCGVVF